jgi:hypothetical protein
MIIPAFPGSAGCLWPVSAWRETRLANPASNACQHELLFMLHCTKVNPAFALQYQYRMDRRIWRVNALAIALS